MARKLTYEEVKERVYKSGFELTTTKDEFLNEYTDQYSLLKYKCKCGHVFSQSFKYFMKSCCCEKCHKNDERYGTKLSYDYVKKYIEKEGYILISKEYKGILKHIKIKCNKGHIYKTTFNDFKNGGRRCAKCAFIRNANKQRKTTEQFKQEVYDLVGDEYIVISQYIGANSYIKIKHSNCDHVWGITPSAFLRGTRCPQCNRPNYYRDAEQFKQEIYELVKDEYVFLEDYISSLTRIKCKHNVCGQVWEITPSAFLQGTRCPTCAVKRIAEKLAKTQEEYESEIKSIYGNEYIIIGKYINSNTHIKVKHNICGYIWDVVPRSLLMGNGCPMCASSKGEKAIRNFLNNNNIEHGEEYTFDDCRNKRPLPFDFYLPDYNLLIEYDGEQHFEPVNFGGIDDTRALKNHKTTKKHDNIKNKYCLKHKIPLLRIPYWEFDNIEGILEQALFNNDSAFLVA